MAIPTKFNITFACGHEDEVDLSDRPAGKRVGFANWLSRRDCTACWKKANASEDIEKRRERAETNAKKWELPELDGTAKQLEWAPLFRDQIITTAHESLVMGDDAAMTDDDFETRIMAHARHITRAGWWMDNSKAEPEDVEELVSTALDDDETTNGTENPF